jgi:phosphohistidine phosphatase
LKELFLIRHAKSSWEDASLIDFERPLNSRGIKDASLIGEVLSTHGIVPDLIISSPAVRAFSTATIIAERIEYEINAIEKNKELYEASITSGLKVINGISDKFNRVFLFGHNPTFTMLIDKLGGHQIANLPTCGVVGIRFELSSLEMIIEGIGSQFFYDFPKQHK